MSMSLCCLDRSYVMRTVAIVRSMPPFHAERGALLAFLRPSEDVKKGERATVLGILCRDLESKAYIGTCLTEEAVLQTWAYSDIKKAYQRYEQLSVEYDVDDVTQALGLLYNQFIQCDDFAEQVGKS
jgi:hypothetical protein